MLNTILFVAALGATNQEATPSFAGSWVGTLEYRDYSDNSRQKLATLLRITKTKEAGVWLFRYVYDDGPKKVIQELERVAVDFSKKSYAVTSEDGKEVNRYELKSELKSNGTGDLVLTGKGTENEKPVDVLTTIHIERSKFTIRRETRLPGEKFAFRHQFSFTRVD